MKKCTAKKWLLAAALASTLAMPAADAAEPATGIIGKNEWLFYRYEMTHAHDAEKTNVSLDLIQRLNRVLAANQIGMAVAMVPLKMRIYAEHLPDEIKINDYMGANYERMSRVLRAAGVPVIDLSTAFLTSPKRNSDSPLFFRLDSNWTPTGAMVAAEAAKAEIVINPALKSALEATPEAGFKMTAGNRKRLSKGRDLVQYLPPNSLTFTPEQVTQVSVSRVQPPKEYPPGQRPPIGLTLLGSGYSHDWTGFPDALRYVLQRDLLSIGVGTDQGSWVGMESYLRGDDFQGKAPRLVIWEMPERDMRAPPDYAFRDPRYISNNSEWLLRVSALVQARCRPSAVTARLAPAGLAANAAHLKDGGITTGPVNDGDFIDISFDPPIEKLDYLVALAITNGSGAMTLEGSAPGVATRRFTLNVPGDGVAHALKTPLPSAGAGFTQVRIFPGKSQSFALHGLQVCRQPDDLLK